MIHYIGIDPGKTGAFAVLADDLQDLQIFKFPATIAQLIDIFEDIIDDFTVGLVAIEKQQAAPQQGSSRTFVHGQNYGTWLGALAAMRLPHTIVAPRTWQYKIFDSITRKDDTKVVSMDFAKRRFPGASIGRDHNKADAVNLALYARKIMREE